MKPKKMEIIRQERIASWDKFMSSRSESKVQQRKESGGYSRPGSYKRT